MKLGAGENIGVAKIRDFAPVIDREKAALGLFITVAEPTRDGCVRQNIDSIA